jgi:hypothetical protein
MGLPAFRREPGPGSGSIGSPHPLRPLKALGVFPDRACVKTRRSRRAAHRLGLPYRVLSPYSTPARPKPAGTLLGFGSLRHIQEHRLLAGFASPDSSRSGIPPPFSDVLPVRPSGLVSCRSAHGIHPSGLFPRSSDVPVSRPLLSYRYTNPFLPSLLRRRRKPGEWIGFRALLTVRIRTHQTARKRRGGPMPSWGCASLGCSLHAIGGASPELSRTSDAALPPTGARRSATTCTTEHYQPQDRNRLSQGVRPFRGFRPLRRT